MPGLCAPTLILRDMYGDFVEVRRPRVRCVPGDPPHEPVMHVRITTRTDYLWLVIAELRAREARELERCTRGRIEVLRAEAPLAALMGLSRTLAAITDRTADVRMRLVRYQPIPEPPKSAA